MRYVRFTLVKVAVGTFTLPLSITMNILSITEYTSKDELELRAIWYQHQYLHSAPQPAHGSKEQSKHDTSSPRQNFANYLQNFGQ